MTTDYKKTSKTPSKSLRIADFDFLNRSQPKYINTQVTQTRASMAPPMTQPKRIAELLEEMMPPLGRNSTAKKFRNQTQIQKNYMSTSKKQNFSRKTDHVIVRRALNFIGNKVEDVQLHPKSKPISRMYIGSKYKQIGTTATNHSTNQVKEPIKATVSPEIVKNVADPIHQYDLRSSKKFETFLQKSVEKKPIEYTQYRNVPNSLDDSICDVKSPMAIPFEKIVELEEISQKESDASDSLCDMLVKANISSPKLSRQIQLIKSKISENNDLINSQMDFLDSIVKEIDRSKQKLTMCLENNKLALDMVSNLTMKNTNPVMYASDNGLLKNNQPTTCNIITSVQSKPEETAIKNINHTKQDEGKILNSLPVNNMKLELLPLGEDKENIKTMPSTKTNYNCNLRKAVLLSTFSNNKKSINKTPKSKNGIVINEILKPPTPKNNKSSPKNKQLSENIRSPATSKSLQMYKTLKDTVNFLKTPVGKKSLASDFTFETPNTRSRNITSTNIKRQLESLYDS